MNKTKLMKSIYDYAQKEYAKYDALEGVYTGEKYTDKIFKELADKYSMTEKEISRLYMLYITSCGNR